MKQTIKQQWVDALRSGQYQQGQAYLRNEDNKYCCLGVLSELAVQAGVIPAPQLAEAGPTDREPCYLYGENKEPYYLAREIREWAGLDSESDPTIYGLDDDDDENEFGTSLSDMNDRGDGFEEIADIIEEHL